MTSFLEMAIKSATGVDPAKFRDNMAETTKILQSADAEDLYNTLTPHDAQSDFITTQRAINNEIKFALRILALVRFMQEYTKTKVANDIAVKMKKLASFNSPKPRALIRMTSPSIPKNDAIKIPINTSWSAFFSDSKVACV